MGDFAKSFRLLSFTAPFNNMQNLNFKADQPLNSFFTYCQSNKCLAAPPSFRLLPSTVSLSELCTTI